MSPSNAPADRATLFPGQSEMAERMRALDWSSTPLGPVEGWSQSLKTAVRIMLASRQPIWIGWGPELIYLYNDPYQDILGGRHPVALGKATRDVWPEIWDVIGPMLETAMTGVEGTYVEEQLLIMERHGYPEETYYTFSYTPVPDDHGGTGGIICANTDDTQRVLGERRLSALSVVASAVTDAKDATTACQRAAIALGESVHDVPFALFYLTENDGERGHGAKLVATTGIEIGHPAAPEWIALSGTDAKAAFWPLHQIHSTKVTLTGLDKHAALSGGPWPEPTHTAVVLPLSSSAQEQPFGFLVAGVSPRRALDDRYEGFFDLLAGSIASGIVTARAFEEERRRAEALAEIDRAKTTFFSNVSHEFRTPLTLMLAPLEELLARRTADLSAAAASSLELVNRNGLRLLKLVNTLLDFSRIEAGRVQAIFEPTDLSAFTAELASVFRSATERAGLRLIVECPPLPEPVFVDHDMWEKVVLNLLSNAFKFTFEGEITVSLTSAAGQVELRVRDTGVGVPAEEMPRLFERFHRIESSRSRTHEGSGIGLALVQELVRLHGGTVHAESEFGRGTTFIVTLPFGKAHLPPEQIGSRPSATSTVAAAVPFVEEALRWLPDTPAPAGRELSELPATTQALGAPFLQPDKADTAENRSRIFVADDNGDMRQYLARLLGERYEVIVFPDGEAALAAVRERRPDLILSDVMMPRLDGFELVRRLRRDEVTRTIPIVLLSARAGEESRVEGLDVGADDYLVKPFSARELLARVESHLKLAQVREQAEQRVTQILESITDGFHTLDKLRRFTHFNAAGREMFAAQGIDVDALLGQDFFEVFPMAREMPTGRAFERTFSERVPTAVENFFAPWERWFNVRHFPMPDGGVATFFQDITEAKLAEEKERKGYETFRNLVENSPFGVYAVDADFRLAQVSAGARRTFEGVEPLLGRDFAEVLRCIWPEPFASEAIERFRHTLETGEPYHSPRTIEQRHDRDIVESYDWRIERVPLPDGRLGAVCHFYDLSERQSYEAALRASEARFRLLAESLPQFVWESDAAGVQQFVNQHWINYSGLTLEETRDAERMRAVTHPEDAERLNAAWAQAQATGTPMQIEARLRRRDGEYRWFLIRTEPLIQEGRVLRWFGTSTDITEHKLAVETERHFFTLTNALLIEADFDGWLRRVNPAWETLLGWSAAELTSRPLMEFVHPDDHATALVALERLKTQGLPVSDFDIRCRCRDGSYRWIRLNTSPAPERRAFYGVAQDVTEQIRAQEALRQSAEEANAANRAKDDFLAALSHELRTPLTPVLMSASVLRQDEHLPAHAREQLAMIERNIMLEARLIDDLLDLTRITKGKLDLRRQLCDAHTLIALAVEIVRDTAQEKRITLECDFAASRSGISADPTRFQQVIWNLLRNAVRFTPRGGQIAVRTRNYGASNGTAHLHIEVTDTGIGIDPAALDRIFAPFEQAALAGEHRFGGLGLGLAIARSIVEMHGGTIRAESSGPGTGATFTIELPDATEPVIGARPLPPNTRTTSSFADVPLRLLLVEDHEPTLRILSNLLARAGHHLTTASSVTDALSAAATASHDLVISDLGLPDGTGLELMKRLREKYNLTGIALSGYGMEDDIMRSRAAGFAAHLVKPIDFDQLRRALSDVATFAKQNASSAGVSQDR